MLIRNEDTPADMLVIDGNYIGYKAFFAFSDMIYDGDATPVILGFMRDILTFSRKFNTTNIVFVWDDYRSYRGDAYSAYKAKRKGKRKAESPEDTKNRKSAYAIFGDLRKTILPKLGFKTQLHQKGLEGDDLMEMVVKQQHKEGFQGHTVIITADEDLYQSIYPHVSMWMPQKKLLMTSYSFESLYGITPKQWWKVKALGGCSSDNVAGIKKIGEKTAIKYILGELGTHLKTYESIVSEEGKEIYKTNKPLVKLPHKKTAPVEIEENKLVYKELRRLFKKYGFLSELSPERKRLWKAMFNNKPTSAKELKKLRNKSKNRKIKKS